MAQQAPHLAKHRAGPIGPRPARLHEADGLLQAGTRRSIWGKTSCFAQIEIVLLAGRLNSSGSRTL